MGNMKGECLDQCKYIVMDIDIRRMRDNKKVRVVVKE